MSLKTRINGKKPQTARRTATVGGKEVLLAEPYRPRVQPECVGMEHAKRLITAAWMRSDGNHLELHPFLIGAPGVGKTHVCCEMARQSGRDLYIIQGHEDITAEDIACTVRFSDDPDARMEYVASPLVTSMLLGQVCLIDELGKLRPKALASLASVLDYRGYVDSILLGARVEAHPGFRFCASTNTADMAGNAVPEFILSRLLPRISVGYPRREQVEKIIARRFTELKDVGALFGMFWDDLWFRHPGSEPPTPRQTIQVFALAANLAACEALGPAKARRTLRGNGTTSVEARHLELAFAQIFNNQEGEKDEAEDEPVHADSW